MAITYLQSAANSAAGGAAVTVTLAQAPLAGSALVAFVHSEAVVSNFPAPAGWTRVRQAVSSSTALAVAIFVKASAGAADTSTTFTATGAGTTIATVLEYQGASAVALASGIANNAGYAGVQLPALGSPAGGAALAYYAGGTGSTHDPRWYTGRVTAAGVGRTLDYLPLPMPALVGANAGVEIRPVLGGANGEATSDTFTVPPNTVVTLAFHDNGPGGAYFHNISFDGDAGVNNLVAAAGDYNFTRVTPNDGANHQVHSFITALGSANIAYGTLTAPGATPAYDPTAGWFTGSAVSTSAGLVIPPAPAGALFPRGYW